MAMVSAQCILLRGESAGSKIGSRADPVPAAASACLPYKPADTTAAIAVNVSPPSRHLVVSCPYKPPPPPLHEVSFIPSPPLAALLYYLSQVFVFLFCFFFQNARVTGSGRAARETPGERRARRGPSDTPRALAPIPRPRGIHPFHLINLLKV